MHSQVHAQAADQHSQSAKGMSSKGVRWLFLMEEIHGVSCSDTARNEGAISDQCTLTPRFILCMNLCHMGAWGSELDSPQ